MDCRVTVDLENLRKDGRANSEGIEYKDVQKRGVNDVNKEGMKWKWSTDCKEWINR